MEESFTLSAFCVGVYFRGVEENTAKLADAKLPTRQILMLTPVSMFTTPPVIEEINEKCPKP